MKKYLLTAVLLLSGLSAIAQEPSAQCKKYMRDVAMIYVYGLACEDDESMDKLFGSRQNEQAAIKLLDNAEAHCQNADEALVKSVEDELVQDPKLMDILDNPQQDTAAFCKTKASMLERILNAYK